MFSKSPTYFAAAALAALALPTVAIAEPPAGTPRAAPVVDVLPLQVTTRELGTLGGDYSRATDVDGSVVVGVSDVASGDRHAFAYDLETDTEMRDLGDFGSGYVDQVLVDGQLVAGTSMRPDGNMGAFYYDLAAEDPEMVDLGTLGGVNSTEVDAVDGTRIAGTAETATGERHAFVYNVAAPVPHMRDLGTLAGDGPHGSNVPVAWVDDLDGAVVVGRSNTEQGIQHAFVYDLAAPDPHMVDIGIGGRSGASAVEGDLVVGTFNDRFGQRGFTYRLDAARPRAVPLPYTGGLQFGSVDLVDAGLLVGAGGEDERPDPLPWTRYGAFIYDLAAATPHWVDIGSLGYSTWASSTADGLVVGRSRSLVGKHAFAYDADAVHPRIVDLTPDETGQSDAVAVDGTTAVGWVSQPGETGRREVPRAVAWTLSYGPAPSIRLARLLEDVGEDAGEARVEVLRDGDTSGPVDVEWSASALPGRHGATAGADFAPVSGTVSFPAGESRAELVVPVVDDLEVESPERIALRLTAANGAQLGGLASGWLIIRESDLRPDTQLRSRPDGAFVGDDVYGTGGTCQTLERTAQPGRTVRFTFSAGLDPLQPPVEDYRGRLLLTSPPDVAGGTVHYTRHRGNVDVTAELRRGLLLWRGGRADSRGPTNAVIGVSIRLDGDVRPGTRVTAALHAASAAEQHPVDCVRAVVVAR